MNAMANDKQQIKEFVSNLPQSIEELYIELDNSDLVPDEDEDFDPIAGLPATIFATLKRLHTLDIIGWVGDVDRGTVFLPEKAIICRRRPWSKDSQNINRKDVWVSRMQSIYQEQRTDVTNTKIELEGDFEGQDAAEPWLGGRKSWLSHNSNHWAKGEYSVGEDAEYDDVVDDEQGDGFYDLSED